MKERMPALFVGHVSPMNAIEDNEYSRNWARIGEKIKKPEAILAVSAHWYTSGTRIMDDANPKMVYDMYGFPEELYQVEYPAKGSPDAAHLAKNLSKISWDMESGHPWAVDFDQYIKENIKNRTHQGIIHYENAGSSSKLAVPTPDHFYPLLYVLGASNQEDQLTVFNDSCTMGSLSMTSYLFE